mmetsp:Transcript_29705/g.50164  ORF Transcript_29705/g.50164 Transcript_29705/m.50164 type:complete len:201 (-) Transcript_29705:1133-1735(-)
MAANFRSSSSLASFWAARVSSKNFRRLSSRIFLPLAVNLFMKFLLSIFPILPLSNSCISTPISSGVASTLNTRFKFSRNKPGGIRATSNASRLGAAGWDLSKPSLALSSFSIIEVLSASAKLKLTVNVCRVASSSILRWCSFSLSSSSRRCFMRCAFSTLARSAIPNWRKYCKNSLQLISVPVQLNKSKTAPTSLADSFN